MLKLANALEYCAAVAQDAKAVSLGTFSKTGGSKSAGFDPDK